MGALRRFFSRLAESDEQRLDAEIRDWARSVPGAVPIGEAPGRTRTKVAGVVKRIRVNPSAGNESLEALIVDGTGEIAVVFMGRRSIGGLTLGTKIAVEGVIGEARGGRKMVNPTFDFAG